MLHKSKWQQHVIRVLSLPLSICLYLPKNVWLIWGFLNNTTTSQKRLILTNVKIFNTRITTKTMPENGNLSKSHDLFCDTAFSNTGKHGNSLRPMCLVAIDFYAKFCVIIGLCFQNCLCTASYVKHCQMVFWFGTFLDYRFGFMRTFGSRCLDVKCRQ